MSENAGIKARRLPDGVFCEASEKAWRGRILEIQLAADGPVAEFTAGGLVELRSETELYLGVVQEIEGKTARVLVEHYLRWDQVEWIEETWG